MKPIIIQALPVQEKPRQVSTPHDLGYKELFSNPELVQELLENFVDQPFVKEIDYSTLQRVDKTFVTRAHKRRESDLIFKVKYRGSDAYIHLLMEFQSSNDHWMALRMLRYICEFYSDLTKNFKSPKKRLPAVFPIMLYNGDRRWISPQCLADLIEPSGIDQRFIPQFSYYKIAENEFSDELLLAMKNAIAAVFYAERSDETHFSTHIGTIAQLIRLEKPEIVNALERWLFGLLKTEGAHDLILEEFADLKGDKPMLATTVRKFAELNKKEGFEQGIEQGIEQGLRLKALEDAKKLKATGVDLATIANCIGLSMDEVKTL